MKNLVRIIFLTLFVILVNNRISLAAATKGKGNDTTSIKSNIVVFKLITSPITPTPSSNKSLKKAGSVARTSGSHTVVTVKPAPNEG
jgi:hypothetical protein